MGKITLPMRMTAMRKTAADWTAANSVLYAGEIAVESDTRKAKIGDGATAWNDLPYAFAADSGGGGDTDVDALYSGVFIIYNSSTSTYLARPSEWPALQEAGDVALGVCVIEGGRHIVIAPTESASTLYWSSSSVSGGGTTTTDRATALTDMEGKTSTEAQITHSACSGESYAPGFCAAYSVTGKGSYGYPAGNWWLPSLGELMMIYANKTKINYALSLIDGAAQLTEGVYWSSTEYSSTNAWRFLMSSGSVNNNRNKDGTKTYVRAVSAFLAASAV